jgi:hypothetical protein
MNGILLAVLVFASSGTDAGDVGDEANCCTPRGAALYDGISGDPIVLKATKLTLEDEFQLDVDKSLVICSATRQIGVALPDDAPKDGYSLLIVFPESRHAYRFTCPVMTRRPRSVRWSKDDGLFLVTAPEQGGLANLKCEHSIYIKIDTTAWKPELVYVLPHHFN